MATFTIDNSKASNNVSGETVLPKPSPTLNTYRATGTVRQASRWAQSVESNTPIIFGYTKGIAGLPFPGYGGAFRVALIGRFPPMLCFSGYTYYKGAWGVSAGKESEYWYNGPNCNMVNEKPKKFVRNPLTATAMREGHFNIYTGKFDPGYPEKSGDYFFYSPLNIGKVVYKTGMGTSELTNHAGTGPTVPFLDVTDRSEIISITPAL